MTNNITVKVSELPGQLGHLKASQLARLIEGYIKEHPEITSVSKADKEETT
ncbi:MAG: hypothetical protein J5851_08875 [Oscillospiraceae bacterium]|nr:hypothetical protein [Oscillospiraceae bacterium]